MQEGKKKCDACACKCFSMVHSVEITDTVLLPSVLLITAFVGIVREVGLAVGLF